MIRVSRPAARVLLTGEVIPGRRKGTLWINEHNLFTGECDVYTIGEEVEVISVPDIIQFTH